MTSEDIRKMRDLDNAAERAGGYVSPPSKPGAQYDYRKILEYCKEKDIDPIDLTVREMQRFIVHPN